MSEDVHLDRVCMNFGAFRAVDNVDVTIKAGEFFSFLGPSGCGKTTILRMISGFIDPTEGAVRIGGRDMRGIRPNQRPTALIFQNLALFPLMPIWENIAFGLEVRGVDKPQRRERAEELLRLVDLPGAADKTVGQLSGGQKQRVAIARALAVEPKVMLLDEPLSALDLKLRQHMRSELRAIQKRTNVTFIYITHDQGEALAMSDRVGIMSNGVLQQVGVPQEIYNNPANGFVASFVGENNVIPGPGDRRQQRVGADRDRVRHLQCPARTRHRPGQLGQAVRAAGALRFWRRTGYRAQRAAGRDHRGRVRGQFHQRARPRRSGRGLHGAGPQRPRRAGARCRSTAAP